MQLSEEARHQGYTVFYRGPERDYNDEALSRWLRTVYFDRSRAAGCLRRIPFAEGFAVLLIALVFAGRART